MDMKDFGIDISDTGSNEYKYNRIKHIGSNHEK